VVLISCYTPFSINEEDVFTAIGDLMETCKGAYACVGMLAGFGLIGFRDPNGIRPLGVATRQSTTKPSGVDYLMASESVVADAVGFSNWQDVQPGEAIIITRNGFTKRTVAKPATFSPDIFEYVYFARPDSTMDGISVYRSRMAMGDALAKEARKVLTAKGIEIDVVIPVPDTSRVAALQLAQNMGIPYREGFVKNRYIGRTFIMPGQTMRRKNVRRKLNAMPLEFAGKNVMLVDGMYLEAPRTEVMAANRPDPHRLHRSRYHFERDRSDGQGCWREERHLCFMCSSHPSLQRLRNRHAFSNRAGRS